MKNLFILTVSIIFIAFTSCKSDKLIDNFAYKSETQLYEPVFIDFDINIPHHDPRNAKQIQVDLRIITPNTDTLILPCFYMQENNAPNKWQARFTPRIVGNYSFNVVANTPQKTACSKIQKIICTELNQPESNKGLLTLDNTDYYYMKYDNGERFKGLGLNVGWVFEPKWNNPDKYSFEMFFKEMQKHGANYIRMWICPWNMPIEWTPVPEYKMVFEEFADLSKVFEHSEGLKISEGTTKECQSDEGQLIKISETDEYIIYKVGAPKLFKLMIYNKGQLSLNDFELSVSADNKTYNPVETTFSESWNSFEDWQRIFLYSYNLGDENIKYVKLILKNSLISKNIKLSGIQLRYGDPVSVLDCNGLNNYSKNNSEKLDSLIKLADEYGIKILVTLGYHGQFKPIMDSWGANDEWQRNPYNKKNGGPCETPGDFFINEEARIAYKNYLRYFVARWGYSSVVAGWELWNEIDIIQRSQNLPENDLVSWHAEMSGFLKQIDPYNHMVTTSFSHGKSDALWKIKDIDITHTHHYSPTIKFIELSKQMSNKFGKPHLIGEYAVDWKGPGFGYTDQDYEEEFHDGMWRGIFTKTPVLPLSWWWEYHLDNGHYKYFKPLRIAINKVIEAESTITLLEMKPQTGYEILGLQNKETKLVWIKDIDKAKKNTNIRVSIDLDAKSKISFMNTYTGVINNIENPEFKDGNLIINAKQLSLNGDILIIIEGID